MSETDRLLKIKEQIDNAKNKRSEVVGQIKSIDEQILQGFEAANLKEAEGKLKEIGAELDGQEAEFEKGMEELEKAYQWD